MAMEGGWLLQLLTDSLFHSSSLFSMWDVTPFSKCMTKDSYQPSVFPSFYMFLAVAFDLGAVYVLRSYERAILDPLPPRSFIR